MVDCYLCKRPTYACEMSSYRLAGGEPVVGSVCADCANGVTQVSKDVSVNNFTIVENQFNGYDSEKKYLVFHPIYDGAYEVFASDDNQEVIDWCNHQNYDEWTQNLL